MSILIMSEVFVHSDTRLATRLVLLALADAANDSHRMCWESVDTIASKARVSRRQTFTALAELAKRHVIEDVPEDDQPLAARRYKTAVRRILPVAEWMPEPEKGAESAPVEGGAESARVSKFSPNPNNPIVEIEVLRTSGAHSAPIEDNHRPGARGWDAVQPLRRGGRKSKKQEALERAQAELELDPAYIAAQTLADDAPAAPLAARLPASDDDLAQPDQRARKPRSKSQAERLADGFARWAKQVGHAVPGSTNKAALTRNLRRWMTEGAEYQDIVRMIETYWSPTWQRSDNTEAWKDFQNQRGALTQRLGKVAQAKQAEDNRYDESAW